MFENLSISAGATALLFCAASSVSSADAAQFFTKKASVEVETIASGLDNPWSVEVLPDGAFLVTELAGNLRIIRDGKLSEPITGVPKVARHGQGGLLDIALDRGFATNRTLFLSMAVADGSRTGRRLCAASCQPMAKA